MKHKFIIFSFYILLFSLTALGQNVEKQIDPDYIGVFHRLDSNSNTLIQLERQVTQSTVKWGLIKGAKGSSFVTGEKSPVRFTADEAMEFVIRVESNLVDPATIFTITKFDIEKGNRTLTTVKSKPGLFKNKTSSTQAEFIPFRVWKYGQSSFKLAPAQDLTEGEYVLAHKKLGNVFCFGVDAPNPKQANAREAVVGKYIDDKNSSNQLVLKSDGGFDLQQDGKEFSGRYQVNNNIVTFILSNVVIAKAQFQGDTIFDPDGKKWLRQK